MFTLKLFRRQSVGDRHNCLVTAVLPVHHVETHEIGDETIELRAFATAAPHPYESWYIGYRAPDMTALNDDNHWGWGLLENWEGNTSQHFRPYTYG